MKRILPVLVLVVGLTLLSGCFTFRFEDIFQELEPSSPDVVRTEPLDTPPSTEPSTEPSVVPSTPPVTEPGDETPVLQYRNIKAMWLSQYDLTGIYLDDGVQRDESGFTALMIRVLDNVKAQGFNTVFLQIRPNGDSMYPSAFYPMSAYVVGRLGEQARYDPVEIIIRLAHEQSLSVHGWINPMRGMSEEEILLIGEEYPIRQWYDDPGLCGKYIVLVDGRWYLNPAYDAVAELICNGAGEALELYDFDGLHMDDYFYPTADASFDAAAYDDYRKNGGTMDLADFRRDALNRLVAGLYGITGSSRDGRIFGISPAGNVKTVYNSQFADIYTWCAKPGYIDYICPQVYFGLEHGSHDFVKVCRTYQDMIKTDAVELLVGMTFGKAMTEADQWAGSGKDEWKNNKDVLARCLQTTRDLEACRGVSVFCYQYFFDPVTGESISQTARERENFVPVLQDITWN